MKGLITDRLHIMLKDQGNIPVIPVRCNRRQPIQSDEPRYKEQLAHRRDVLLSQGVGFAALRVRHIATRYDKRNPDFLSTAHLATAIAPWLPMSPSSSGAPLPPRFRAS
ncbi:MAG: hypothetical protein SNJ52_05525, partial [Verrucomicrobiia bacterium]